MGKQLWYFILLMTVQSMVLTTIPLFLTGIFGQPYALGMALFQIALIFVTMKYVSKKI